MQKLKIKMKEFLEIIWSETHSSANIFTFKFSSLKNNVLLRQQDVTSIWEFCRIRRRDFATVISGDKSGDSWHSVYAHKYVGNEGTSFPLYLQVKRREKNPYDSLKSCVCAHARTYCVPVIPFGFANGVSRANQKRIRHNIYVCGMVYSIIVISALLFWSSPLSNSIHFFVDSKSQHI